MGSWRDNITEAEASEVDSLVKSIHLHSNHQRSGSAATRRLRYDRKRKCTVEVEGSTVTHGRPMFPYKSPSMAANPEDVPAIRERLKRCGGAARFTEFDEHGQPIITSAKQHADLAKALGMKTGRDGYGHTDEMGNFHNSGRRRNDEVQAGRAKVRKAINELEAMPDDVSPATVANVLNQYDISPTEENTG